MSIRREKITFTNANGDELAALLEKPDQPAEAFALFAHCFTCGKDIAAATRISRALAARGIAVLRFDFTGLGGSDGDFANTHFSSNVRDLISAADYMREQLAAPSLLIGHSLGGTAMLAAAAKIPESRAVVTIGAPASPGHVKKQLGDAVETLREQGEAEVTLAGRSLTLKESFLDDIDNQRLEARVAGLKRALLIMHSPLDKVVSVHEAARLFQMARHPKSFVSLDDADHLLSDASEAEYVAHTIAAWASRYMPRPGSHDRDGEPAPSGEVRVDEHNRHFLRGIYTDHHFFHADEPRDAGGTDLGPDPYELLLASLGSCTSMTIRMYANHKQWPLDEVRVRLSHDRQHDQDCKDCDNKDGKVDVIHRYIHLEGDLDDKQRQRLIEIADRCPVHKTLLNLGRIETEEEDGKKGEGN